MPLRVPARVSRSSDLVSLRTAADQVFSRTAGAPLVGGNAVRVLRDAAENYPAWEEAIRSAERSINVEMYIFHRDRVGRHFVDLLTERARAGVTVRVIYDWFGAGIGPMLGLFTPLIEAGGKVLAFNPPSAANAFGWVRRDHRKLITVDRRVAFISGLCIGQAWVGDPARGREPWRDTGVEIVGPAVAHAEAAFADSWMLAGGRAADAEVAHGSETAAAGDVNLRLIPTEPFTANMLRLDLLVGSLARKSLWLTDAYFIGTGPYLEALSRAARDGVDVRLLVPRDSDVGWTVPVSRALYRPLLEAGVRIFEWSGTMVHAKTAVADSRWSRIGSTNLNINSWIGNWELDVAIEDVGVARTLEAHFEADLERSVEIRLATGGNRQRHRAGRRARPSRQVVRTVTGVGRSLGAAVTGNRTLENYELKPIMVAAVLLAAIGLVGVFAPWILAWPLAGLAAWVAVTLLVEAWRVWRQHSP